MEITLSVRKITRFLFFIVLGLAIAAIAGQFSKHILGNPLLFGLDGQLNLENEKTLPVYYSGLSLLFCSLLLATIAASKKRDRARYARHWQGLSLIFFYLALDEVFELHEKTTEPLKALLNNSGSHFLTSGVFAFTWVILGIVFVLLVLLAYARFLAALPAKTRFLFIIAGTLFVMGALGAEMVGSYWEDLHGKDNFTYGLIANVEEILEMFGVVVFIYALLSYMSSHLKEVRIRLKGDEPAVVKTQLHPVGSFNQKLH